MKSLFALDGPIFAFFQKIADLFILNVAFILCCLPVFTIGPATSALYSVTMEMIRKENPRLFKHYIEQFKRYFRQSFIVELIFLLIGIFLVFDYVVFEAMGGMFVIFKYLILLTGLYCLFALMYVFCVIPVFDNKVKNALRNAFVLPFVHLPWTLFIFVVQALILYASFNDINMFFKYFIILWLSIGFAATAYVCSFLFYRAFMKYFPEWEEEYQKDLEELRK